MENLSDSDTCRTLNQKREDLIKMKPTNLSSKKNKKMTVCDHRYYPTFQGGDTYKCEKCGNEIDITED